MINHFKNIEFLHGNASVQIPNSIFRDLSRAITTNVQQVAFAYTYLVTIAFLYKYAHYIDVDNGTYVQNADIKELLGYSKTTKSVDVVIKKNGILDEMGLTETIKNYPIRFIKHPTETINNIALREFVSIGELVANDINYTTIKSIVKNRNYTVKEPLFLTTSYGDREYGTLYEYGNTHQITIAEILEFLFNENFDNLDFLMYGYFKSKCNNYKDNTKSLGLNRMIAELNISKDAFYSHLKKLKEVKFIEVNHKNWMMGDSESFESNEYRFNGFQNSSR